MHYRCCNSRLGSCCRETMVKSSCKKAVQFLQLNKTSNHVLYNIRNKKGNSVSNLHTRTVNQIKVMYGLTTFAILSVL